VDEIYKASAVDARIFIRGRKKRSEICIWYQTHDACNASNVRITT